MTISARRILIVDDSDFIRKVVKIHLERTAGWEVLTARSGDDAMTQIGTVTPDAILLDLVMPDRDGPMVLQDFQSNGTTRESPVIFLTAREQSDDGLDLIALGAVAVIAKPFNPETLALQIGTLLGWAR
jgi:DNA-binding response OmpR family regulator